MSKPQRASASLAPGPQISASQPSTTNMPNFMQGSSLYGTQNLGVGLPAFMQPAFNVFP